MSEEMKNLIGEYGRVCVLQYRVGAQADRGEQDWSDDISKCEIYKQNLLDQIMRLIKGTK